MAPGGVTPEFVAALRSGAEVIETSSDDALSREEAFEVTTIMAPSSSGGPDVPLLVCTPRGAQSAASVVFLHGGGMVAGDNRNGVDEILDWAEELSLSVVSVDYRLAPETKHPGLVEDCYAGLIWAANNSETLGCPSERIVLAGASAGGGLAASTALLARDRGAPELFGLMLMTPMLDDRNNTPSARQMEGLGVWDLRSNATGWDALLGKAAGGNNVSGYAAAARADNLSGLPPIFLDVGSAETFRDETVTFASRLWDVGGDAELHVWAGGFHAFTGYAAEAMISQQALAARIQWLHRLLHRPAEGR